MKLETKKKDKTNELLSKFRKIDETLDNAELKELNMTLIVLCFH